MATRRNMSEPCILCMITYLSYTVTVSTAGAILIGTLYEIILQLRLSERWSFEPSIIQNIAAKKRYHILSNHWLLYVNINRSQRPHGLRRRSTPTRLLGLWVRILVLSSAIHILKLEGYSEDWHGPAQGWHAKSWSVPQFLSETARQTIPTYTTQIVEKWGKTRWHHQTILTLSYIL